MLKPENAKELTNTILFSSLSTELMACLLNSKCLWMGGHNNVWCCEQQNPGQPCWDMLAFKWATRNTKLVVQLRVLSSIARAQEILQKNHTVQMFIRQATPFMKVCQTALLNPTKEMFSSKQKQSQSQKSVYMKLPKENYPLPVQLLLV